MTSPWTEASIDLPPLTSFIRHGINVTLAGTRRSVEEYIHLVDLRDNGVPALEGKFRAQVTIVMDDLRDLRQQVSTLRDAAKEKRQRSWFQSAATASAFSIARTTIDRIPDGPACLHRVRSMVSSTSPTILNCTTIVCIAFAFLNALWNESMLHACRTIDQRLESLHQRVEERERLNAKDLNALRGYHWEILQSKY